MTKVLTKPQATVHPAPMLGRMSVVHYDRVQHLTTDTRLDHTHIGQSVAATVTLDWIRPTAGGRASGIVTALAGGSAIVTLNADTYRQLRPILTTGTRLILRGIVTDMAGQRVLDVRNGTAVTV